VNQCEVVKKLNGKGCLLRFSVRIFTGLAGGKY
jgi:hypothetical protein